MYAPNASKSNVTKISLCKIKEDLLQMIQQMLPDAPNFCVLLQYQLDNARGRDQKGHRWDPCIISLALNLWTE